MFSTLADAPDRHLQSQVISILDHVGNSPTPWSIYGGCIIPIEPVTHKAIVTPKQRLCGMKRLAFNILPDYPAGSQTVKTQHEHSMQS